MKKLLFPFLFLLFSFKPGERSGIVVLPVIKKELKVESAFQNVRIEGDITVVLTNEPAGKITIEGKEKEVDKVRTGFKDNVFVINASRKKYFAKIIVYLSAVTLQAIQINGNSDICSNDYIKSSHLYITLNGNINVKVKTMGELTVDSPEEIELLWKSPEMKKRNESSVFY